MKHIEEKILSAYANEELPPVDRQLVDAHLVTCAACREKLTGYQLVRQRMETLKTEPAAPEIKENVISMIKDQISPQKPNNSWKRRVLVLVPVAVILISILIIQPWTIWTNPQNIIAQAYSAMSGVQSYRFSITKSGGTEDNGNYSVEFAAPDRYHIIQTADGKSQEYIFIGDTEYYKGDTMEFLTQKAMPNSFSSMLTREGTLNWLDQLGDIRQLTDETIEGVACAHYQGKYDIEKQIRSLQDSMTKNGGPPMSEETIQKMRADMRTMNENVKFELWIGKSDHIIRQMKISNIENNNGANLVSYTIYRFSDFNQSITINAPIDASGKLFADWGSTSPEQAAFSKDVQVNINNNDPSNRMINYTVTIRNISADTLAGVEIRPDFSTNAGVWTRWTGGLSTPEPWSLASGKSLEFILTFGYNAANLLPDKVAEVIKNSGLHIAYTDSNGQQKAETVHFEVPAIIYTMPTNILAMRDLKPDGEYRINEEGASSAKGDTTGIIGNKNYLFVLVDTENSKTPVEPGLLTLNIQNPAKPVKVSYLKAPEGAKFMMASALSGTNLYISTGSFLWVVDVSNPAAPKELGRLTGTYPTLVTSDKYAYVYDQNRISAMDISDPLHPQLKGSVEVSSPTGVQLDIAGKFLLAWTNNTLYTIDLSSPASPKIVNSHVFSFPVNTDGTTPSSTAAPTYIYGHDINGNYAYVALAQAGKSGISIVDISNPANPHEVAFHIFQDRRIWGDLFATKDRLYTFTQAESGPDRKLKIAVTNITDPLHPADLEFDALPDDWSFSPGASSGSIETRCMIAKYLYWYIGTASDLPVMEIFDLPAN
jgi:hypothetical protein